MLLALAALLVYLALGQTYLFKTDGHFILQRLLADEVGFYNHFLYMPLLMAFRSALAEFGLQLAPHRVATTFSAAGMAAGVLVAHAVCRRLRLRRSDAALATALCATAPAVVFFATVVEFHATFLPFALLAFLAVVAFEQRPTPWRAAVAGAGSGLAFAVHASGVLLPVLLVAWFLAAAPLQRRRLGLAALLLAVHAATCWALANASIALGFGTFPAPADTAAVLRLASPARWLDLPAVGWREAVEPYLPLSLAWLPALLVAPVRRRALALLCGALPFVVLGLAVIPVGQTERGAYLLPCALPAALLTVAVLPRVLVLVVLAVGAGLAFHGVKSHDDGGALYARFAAAVDAARGERPVLLLIATDDELGACVVAMPQQSYHLLTWVAVMPPEQVQPMLPQLEAALRWYWQRGDRVLLSEWARRFLRDPASTPSGPLLAAHLEQAFELRATAADSGSGRGVAFVEVLPRQ